MLFFCQDVLLDDSDHDHDTVVPTTSNPTVDRLFDILEKQKTSIEQILHNQDEIMVIFTSLIVSPAQLL